LKTIFEGVAGLMRSKRRIAVALEEVVRGVDARTALSRRGKALGRRARRGRAGRLDATEYAPARVKQSVCGYGRAEKAQVQAVVEAILGCDALSPSEHAATGARRGDLPRARAAILKLAG